MVRQWHKYSPSSSRVAYTSRGALSQKRSLVSTVWTFSFSAELKAREGVGRGEGWGRGFRARYSGASERDTVIEHSGFAKQVEG